jgi:TatD DNase family protein
LTPYFNLHTHNFCADDSVMALVNQYPNEFDATISFYSIGIHPWYIIENDIDNQLEIFERKLKSPKCLAIGECGLDKRIDFPIEKQIQVFERQLALAKQYNKPVILHCVSAYQEIIQIKKQLQIQQPLIIHGFSKNWQTAKLLLDNGFYISFGKYLFQNPNMKTVFQQTPNNRIFLETDTLNNSISDVYKVAAMYKNIDIIELQELISLNFKTVFKQ